MFAKRKLGMGVRQKRLVICWLHKCEIFFRRNEILFYAENQRKFTYLTSEASSIIEFELIFGIIKDFIESKKIHIEDVMYSTCYFV